MKQQQWDKAAKKKYMGKVFWDISAVVPFFICCIAYNEAPFMDWIKSFFPENYAVESWLWIPIAIWTVGAFIYGWKHEIIPVGGKPFGGYTGG